LSRNSRRDVPYVDWSSLSTVKIVWHPFLFAFGSNRQTSLVRSRSMKYMGSKRWMLGNGLGLLLDSEAPKAGRFFDLFSGSSAVAAFVATRHRLRVQASDLQAFSRVLSASILERTTALPAEEIWSNWFASASNALLGSERPPEVRSFSERSIGRARKWCEQQTDWPITRAYGGHYFSPVQAVWLDALRSTMPRDKVRKAAALAALVDASSHCAAAPGHTAQPFQPTPTASRHLEEAWRRDVSSRVFSALITICKQHALRKGRATIADANQVAKTLQENDLVFIDPPYSGVHYSRFYHVLETVATGVDSEVSGVGRYPPVNLRPQSDYSVKSKSRIAIDSLFKEISERGASAIVTFPEHDCSNGLSGERVLSAAKQYFRVEKKYVSSKLSSLGGTSGVSGKGKERAARRRTRELILLLGN
jgi:adenine-specific DNA-methyltransferase